MSKSGLRGPYRLTFDGIKDSVPTKAPGTYVLGYTGPDGKFYVNHVGRADTDLRSRLTECIGSAALFKYGTFATSREAFEKECELFHDFRPPGNRIHPDRPAGTSWQCPRCRSSGRGW